MYNIRSPGAFPMNWHTRVVLTVPRLDISSWITRGADGKYRPTATPGSLPLPTPQTVSSDLPDAYASPTVSAFLAMVVVVVSREIFSKQRVPHQALPTRFLS